ncbi:hypothetical protein A2J03_12485 [Rhodococcus sp. EPR-157]|nr:hypothetical protein A2J03_12485 [Rhodococcus sp. EPR-157]
MASVHLSLGLGHAAPDSVRLRDTEGVRPALRQHGATAAHLFRSHLPLGTRTAAFAIWVEEHRRVDATAQAVHLPVPDIGIGPREVIRLWHENS